MLDLTSIAVRQVEFMVNANQESVPLFLLVVVALVVLATLGTVETVGTVGPTAAMEGMAAMEAMEALAISSLRPWRRHWLMWVLFPFQVAGDLEVSPTVPTVEMEESAGLEAVVVRVVMEAGKAMKALLAKADLLVPTEIRTTVGVELALVEPFL